MVRTPLRSFGLMRAETLIVDRTLPHLCAAYVRPRYSARANEWNAGIGNACITQQYAPKFVRGGMEQKFLPPEGLPRVGSACCEVMTDSRAGRDPSAEA